MPSTYSPSLKLELIGNGEQAGVWGTTTNTNLGTLLEQAITGVLPITLTGDVTLTDYNGLPDQARNAVLIFNGLLGAPCNVIAPSSQKVYIIRNRANATVTIKTTSGNGISIANAASEVVFCDGTDFYSATQFNYINGNLTVTGNETVGGSLSVGTTITLGGDMFGNSATGQWYMPSGNTTSRTNAPINGIIRYNTELQAYEGYANSNWVTFNVSREGVYNIDYVLVGGGGGGGSSTDSPLVFVGAGGGAGGYLASSISGQYSLTPGVTYTFVIGGGGGAYTNGSNTTGLGFLAYGGGGGGGGARLTGNTGGSGGGAVFNNAAGSGIPPQGNNGGSVGGEGGGGGYAAAGTRSGGAGTSSALTGTTLYYAGGGGGGAYDSGPTNPGGIGGGGAGGNGSGGVAGTVNTGGGGGGGSQPQNAGGNYPGGNGGSGVVVLSIPTLRYTGTTTGSPVLSTFGNATILTYTSSGSYTA